MFEVPIPENVKVLPPDTMLILVRVTELPTLEVIAVVPLLIKASAIRTTEELPLSLTSSDEEPKVSQGVLLILSL